MGCLSHRAGFHGAQCEIDSQRTHDVLISCSLIHKALGVPQVVLSEMVVDTVARLGSSRMDEGCRER